MNIVVEHVTKTIRGTTVLQDINLNFESGKVYGLQGENGSGKTMLLRLMCGLIYATEGKVLANNCHLGRDLDFPASVGAMIESPAFVDEYTGFKNLELLAGLNQLISVPDIQNTLQAVGLQSDDNRPFKKYSLGMKQRLGIAAAIMEKPELLILDEPTNALDEHGVSMIAQLILEERERGALVVIACHDADFVQRVSDVIIQMRDGKVTSVISK
ncbi:MAG: ATP-binding cassette domain-containing protein [Eubacteriales bacterium]|nr:ATP-binding cassette domain-containing protein [Eubacteriales bacterium]